MKHIVLALTLVCGTANAQSFAEVTNFQWTVWDLDPSDGIGASLTWANRPNEAGYVQADAADRSYAVGSTIASAGQSVAVADGMNVRASSVGGQAVAYASLPILDAGPFYDGKRFTLSPNSAVSFSALAQVSGGDSYAQLMGNGVFASQNTLLYAQTNSPGPLNIVFNNATANNFDGFVNAGAVARNWSAAATVAPIPEPQTYALMLAGLLVVAVAVRRRVRAAPLR